jgi:hypothetical protein
MDLAGIIRPKGIVFASDFSVLSHQHRREKNELLLLLVLAARRRRMLRHSLQKKRRPRCPNRKAQGLFEHL